MEMAYSAVAWSPDRRSAMKLEVDRKTFDVAQLIGNAGQSASEVLDNIPSVEVDNDGNVSLRGNSSVEVWINGKASGLTTDNRAQILQQLPAETIESIEVIDNPSAKFSAEGSAGIINIVLKKDRKAGYYGSLQAGANTKGDLYTKLLWRTHDGQEFYARPYTILKAGHWCIDNAPEPWDFDRQAKFTPFYQTVWYDSHAKGEDAVYFFDAEGHAKYKRL